MTIKTLKPSKPINFLQPEELNQRISQELQTTSSPLKYKQEYSAKDLWDILKKHAPETLKWLMHERLTINRGNRIIENKDLTINCASEFHYTHPLLTELEHILADGMMDSYYYEHPDERRVRTPEEKLFRSVIIDFIQLIPIARIINGEAGIEGLEKEFNQLRAHRHGVLKATCNQEKLRELLIISSTRPLKDMFDLYNFIKVLLMTSPRLADLTKHNNKKVLAGKVIEIELNLDSSNTYFDKDNQKINTNKTDNSQAKWIAFLVATGDTFIDRIMMEYPKLHKAISELSDEEKGDLNLLTEIISVALDDEAEVLNKIQNHIYELEKAERISLGKSINKFLEEWGLPHKDSLTRDNYHSANPPVVQKKLPISCSEGSDTTANINTEFNRNNPAFLSPEFKNEYAEKINQTLKERKRNKDNLLDYELKIDYGYSKRGMPEPILNFSVFSLDNHPILTVPFSGRLNDVIMAMRSVCELRKLLDLTEKFLGVRFSVTVITDAGMGVSTARVVTALQDLYYCCKIKGSEQTSKVKAIPRKIKQELIDNPGQEHISKSILICDLDDSTVIRGLGDGAKDISKVEILEYVKHSFSPRVRRQYMKRQNRNIRNLEYLKEEKNIGSIVNVNLSLADVQFNVNKIHWDKLEKNISNSGFNTWVTNNPKLITDKCKFDDIIKSQARQEAIFGTLKDTIKLYPLRCKKIIYCQCLIVLGVRAVGRLEELKHVLNVEDAVDDNDISNEEPKWKTTNNKIINALKKFKVTLKVFNKPVNLSKLEQYDPDELDGCNQYVQVFVNSKVLQDELLRASDNYPESSYCNPNKLTDIDITLKKMVRKFIQSLETLRHLVHCTLLGQNKSFT